MPSYFILDARGLVMHAMHRGIDPDAILNAQDKRAPTAAFGFCQFLTAYLNDFIEYARPRHIIACWDHRSDYRLGVFPGYKKARRERAPDPIAEEQIQGAIERTQQFLTAIGAVQVECPGVEADDIVAFLCQRLDGDKFVHTVDADLAQLAARSDTQVILSKLLLEDNYKGIPFDLIGVYKMLVGDSSDSYPGLPGFGVKTWEKFIAEFGFDGARELGEAVADNRPDVITEAAASDGSGLLIKIADQFAHLRTMLDLATLHPELCDAAQAGIIYRLRWHYGLADRARALALLSDAGAVDMLALYRRFWPTTTLVTQKNAHVAARFAQLFADSPIVAFDFETVDEVGHEPFQSLKSDFVDVLSHRIVGASFTAGTDSQHTIYISTGHADTDNAPLSLVKDLLVQADRASRLVAHNSVFEATVARRHFDGPIAQAITDTRIMACYVDENRPSNLKSLSGHWLGHAQATFQATLDDHGAADMAKLTAEQALVYAADDARCTAALYHLFDLILQSEATRGFVDAYERWPNDVLSDTLAEGWPIDFDTLATMAETDAGEVEHAMTTIRTLLAEHAIEPNEAAVARYMEADREFLTHKAKQAAAKKKTTMPAVWDDWAQRYAEQSVYRPLEHTPATTKFKPTPKQINQVIARLGFSFELASTALSRISEFVVQAQNCDLSADQQRFVDLLAPAAHEIRDQNGAAYQAFHAFCVEIGSQPAAVTTKGDELNFNSPQQMQAMLYLKLGLPVRVRTFPQAGSMRDKNEYPGAPATNERAVALARIHDCPDGDWRADVLDGYLAAKAGLTRRALYYEPYPKWSHPNDGNVHPSILDCGTVTRRPTGASPNFLQVAKGPIRQVFVANKTAGEDSFVVSMDWNGQELRIMASESGDAAMLDAYIGERPKDIHCVAGASIAPLLLARSEPDVLERHCPDGAAMPYAQFFGIAKTETDHADHKAFAQIRQQAKTVNFLIAYLGTASTLALKLGVDTEFAQSIIDGVFATYPRLLPWQDSVIEYARLHGYVKTAYGNRRHLSRDLYSRDKRVRRRMERQAVNAVIQSCAADILKVALTEYKRRRVKEQTGAVGLIPVYDEITARVPRAGVVEYIQTMADIMAITPPGHAVPMVAEVKIGRDWGDMIEIGTDTTTATIEKTLDRLDAQTAKAA